MKRRLLYFTAMWMRVPKGRWRLLATVLLFQLFNVSAQAQTATVTGRISDGTNPVVGATISVEGGSRSVQTNEEGAYSIEAATTGTLIISSVGFEAQRVEIAGRTQIDVTLKVAASDLGEVVVVGYGTQQKVTLTGSVATLSGRDIENIPIANLSNAFAARMPGVNSYQTSGTPGMSSSITVRATGTWNNSAPLYVIDGVVRDKFAFDAIDPADVENISVLKDAASAAVYGAQAANGVVLVTTKRGSSARAAFSYTANFGIEDATRIPATQRAYEQAVFVNDGLQRINTPASDARYFSADELEYFKTHDNNWLEMGWKQPVSQRHRLGVTGGSEKIRYYLGGSYYDANGSFDNLKFKKTTLRSNIDAEIVKNLTASLSLDLDSRNLVKPYWLYDGDDDRMENLYNTLLLKSGMTPPYINGLPAGNYVEWHPLEIIQNRSTGYNRKQWNEYNYTVSLDYKIPFIDGLSLKVQYNKFNRFVFVKQFSQPYTLYNFSTSGGNNHIIGDEVQSTKIRNDGDFLVQQQSNFTSYQLNSYLTYRQVFGKHKVNALFVTEQNETSGDDFTGRMNYFISTAVDQFSAGGSSDPVNSTVSGSGNEYGRMSFVGRLNYTYDDKYIGEISMRRDGSSNFPKATRWGNFPAFSAAWRISREPFFQSVSFVDELKVRASVGLLGNSSVVTNQWRQRFFKTTGSFYGSLTDGLTAGTVPNTLITWEKSLSYDGGVDASLFNNRVDFSLNVFYKKTFDILGPRNLSYPSSFGAGLSDENYGRIDTRGFEMSLGYRGRTSTGIQYYIKGNMGYAVNQLKIIDEAVNIRDYQRRKGFNSDRIFGYEAVGILRTQHDIDALPEGYTINGMVPVLGMMNYRDIRGATSDEPDGKIDGHDQNYIAKHSTPTINYGLSLGFAWKGLSVDLLLQGTGNYQVMHDTRFVNVREGYTTFAFWEDHWTPDNINAQYPASFPRDWGYDDYPASTFWLRKGAFLRLKNINVAYDIRSKALAKAGFNMVSVYLNGTNLFLLQDNMKHRDPEASSFVSYPIMKNISLGLNLNF